MEKVKKLKFDKEVLNLMICRFACAKPIIKQGSIINIKGTNIAYNNYLIFNGSDTLFVNDYSKGIKLKDLEVHIKTN